MNLNIESPVRMAKKDLPNKNSIINPPKKYSHLSAGLPNQALTDIPTLDYFADKSNRAIT
jgi:hypothetical protein